MLLLLRVVSLLILIILLRWMKRLLVSSLLFLHVKLGRRIIHRILLLHVWGRCLCIYWTILTISGWIIWLYRLSSYRLYRLHATSYHHGSRLDHYWLLNYLRLNYCLVRWLGYILCINHWLIHNVSILYICTKYFISKSI